MCGRHLVPEIVAHYGIERLSVFTMQTADYDHGLGLLRVEVGFSKGEWSPVYQIHVDLLAGEVVGALVLPDRAEKVWADAVAEPGERIH